MESIKKTLATKLINLAKNPQSCVRKFNTRMKGHAFFAIQGQKDMIYQKNNPNHSKLIQNNEYAIVINESRNVVVINKLYIDQGNWQCSEVI